MTSHAHLYQLISRNKLKSAVFIITLSVLLGLAGYTLGYLLNWGSEAYIMMGIFIILYNLLLYYTSDKLALAVNRARPASTDEYYELHNVVEEVALAAGIPKPRVYVVDDEAPNAFATGRNPENASVGVTTGLLQQMNREELQGVIAHEVAHIRNYDILLMTIVAILGGLLILFRDIIFRWGIIAGPGRRRASRRGSGQLGLILLLVGIALAVISPILVTLLRAAVSREREYLADATGAYIVRNPHGLANALRKIGSWIGRLKTASDATAHMFTADPFGKDRNTKKNLFATHPPLEERISRLEQLTF